MTQCGSCGRERLDMTLAESLRLLNSSLSSFRVCRRLRFGGLVTLSGSPRRRWERRRDTEKVGDHGYPDTSHHCYYFSPPWRRGLVRSGTLVLGSAWDENIKGSTIMALTKHPSVEQHHAAAGHHAAAAHHHLEAAHEQGQGKIGRASCRERVFRVV